MMFNVHWEPQRSVCYFQPPASSLHQPFGGLGDRGMMDGTPQLCLFPGYSRVDKVAAAVSRVQACFCSGPCLFWDIK